MAKLNAAARRKLPSSDFALPGRRYPIEDRSHAQNAKARVSQHGTPEEKATVRRKVKAKFGFKAGGNVEGEAAAERMDKRRRGGPLKKRASGGSASGPGSQSDDFDDASRSFRANSDKPAWINSPQNNASFQAAEIALDRMKRIVAGRGKPVGTPIYPLDQPEGYPTPRKSGGQTGKRRGGKAC